MKPIKGFDNYNISKTGVIIGQKGIIKPTLSSSGYLKVGLWRNGIHYNKYIHRLVAQHFCEKKQGHLQVDHIDRNKHNNNYKNLRWITPKGNIKNQGVNRYKNTKHRKTVHRSEEVKLEIARLYKNGVSVMDISRKLDIPRQTITTLKNYKKKYGDGK